MRGFTSPKAGTKGVVFLGLVEYEPRQMAVTAPRPGPTTRARANTTRAKAKSQKAQMERMNNAYCAINDDAFDHLKTLLDLKSDEEDSVYAMRPAKRRKLESVFNFLALCDDTVIELAREIPEEDTVEDATSSQAPPASSQATNAAYSEADFARSGKCLCGTKMTEGEMAALEGRKKGVKMVEGKKMVGGKKIVGGKVVFDMMMEKKKMPL